MGTVAVDQVWPDGTVFYDVDTTLRTRDRLQLLLDALPGSRLEDRRGVPVVSFGNHLILSKQVTYLGRPWETFKKRIQIPRTWLDVHEIATREGLVARFVGVYHYAGTTIFVDFEPANYLLGKANNSSAHVATNDLFQAQTLGQFSREDRNGNLLTSVRADQFAAYLMRGYESHDRYLEILKDFSRSLLNGSRIDALEAVQEMHAAGWPDAFQNEWAGFYLEFKLSRYLAENHIADIAVTKDKRRGSFDYDLQFLSRDAVVYYGDLKASSVSVPDSPGNDAADFFRCLDAFGRFWYVIFEHETWHARDNAHLATIAWNEWRRSVGYVGRRREFDSLSYAGRFKESVRFVGVKVLEVNRANADTVLGEFQENFRQPDGSPRKGKVLIRKKHIDNFLIYSHALESDTGNQRLVHRKC